MKLSYIKIFTFAALAGFGMSSCEDFLDRPTEDNYVADGYYKTDEQCLLGTAYLYSSPWSDFTRHFINVGEVLSGNHYPGSENAFLDFTVNSSTPEIQEMSNSLWSVISHCNTVYGYIQRSSGPSQAAKNQTMGECLTWKAMSYFFLVRSFGEVPIVHDNNELIGSNSYSDLPKATRQSTYEYIIMTLEKAIELLPDEPMQAGRIDKAAAQGLLAKVYLAKAGVSGKIDTEDLNKAVKYAEDCLSSSNHGLLEKYEDNFLIKNNVNKEGLIAWRWNAQNNQWTDQSFMQSDYQMEGFSENGDCWGSWRGMSIDLQEEFGIKILEQQPDAWINCIDTRLHATMMLPGFKYDQFWQDKGGFDFLRFVYDKEYNPSVKKEGFTIPTGAAVVKHLSGNQKDHAAAVGYASGRMAYALATQLLRVADVKLVLAEAKLILANPNDPQSASTTDKEAVDAFNDVHTRAGLTAVDHITWEDVWKERRLELAFEGDRWYDFVRVSYYNPDYTIDKLTKQKRNQLWSFDVVAKTYYETGTWSVDTTVTMYAKDHLPLSKAQIELLMKEDPKTNKKFFLLPLPNGDVVFNEKLATSAPAEDVDVRSLYAY
ncbi:MAG: RagB/SusD family nutrient uptake outer membrane protein [Bacteroidaceae bacterium]|nr:RagB/SusD family nutrient uptake outer membrane protein [Bacteroidaceae bacterium]